MVHLCFSIEWCGGSDDERIINACRLAWPLPPTQAKLVFVGSDLDLLAGNLGPHPTMQAGGGGRWGAEPSRAEPNLSLVSGSQARRRVVK